MKKPSLPSSPSPRPVVGKKSSLPSSSDIDSAPLGNRSKTPVCEKCGYNGYPELLIYCIRCQDSSEHWYCQDKLPKRRNEMVLWTCEDCLPKNASPVPSRKSERINDRKSHDTKVKKHMKEVMSGKKACVKSKFQKKDKMADAGQLTGNISATTKEVGNQWLDKGADENKDFKSQRRKLVLLDENSSDEEFSKVGSIKYDKKSVAKAQTDEVSAIQMELKTEMRSLDSEVNCEKEGMADAAKSIDSLSNQWLDKGADENKEFKSQRRKLVLLDENSSDEEFSKVGNIKYDKKSVAKDQTDEVSAIQMELKTEMRSLDSEVNFEKEGMADAARSIDSLSNQWLDKGADENKEFKSQRRKLVLLDENSSDEEFSKVGNIKYDKKSAAKDQTDEVSAIQMELKTEMRFLDSEVDCEKEGMADAAKSINNLLDKKERLVTSRGDQELRNQNRELNLNGNISDEECLIDVEASLSVSRGYCHKTYMSSCPPTLESQGDTIAHPGPNPIWRGSFCICNGKDDYVVSIAAHLSSNACKKACQVAEDLPALLNIDILPRSSVWPVNFQMCPPTNDSIGLYLFPEHERDENVFDTILSNAILHDLALKAVIDEVELLVFSSLVLPQEQWRFHMKYYMWGVFMARGPGD